jgi:hypothetical protein
MVMRRMMIAMTGWALMPLVVPGLANAATLERRLALEPGTQLVVRSNVGSVVVTGDAPDGGVVTLTSPHDDLARYVDLSIDERAGRTTVTAKRRSFGWLSDLFSFDSFRAGARLEIRVPRTTSLDIASAGGSVSASKLTGPVRAHSSGGSVHIEDVAGTITIRSSGGSIVVGKVAGDVAVNTSGGSISVADVRGSVSGESSGGGIRIDSVIGPVVVKTSGGGVHVRNAGGRVQASSVGGSVIVGFARGNNQGGTLYSSGGGVRAEIDPTVALSIDASASGGSVMSEMAVTPRGGATHHSLRADLNGGGQPLKIGSSGGGIVISRAQNQ